MPRINPSSWTSWLGRKEVNGLCLTEDKRAGIRHHVTVRNSCFMVGLFMSGERRYPLLNPQRSALSRLLKGFYHAGIETILTLNILGKSNLNPP